MCVPIATENCSELDAEGVHTSLISFGAHCMHTPNTCLDGNMTWQAKTMARWQAEQRCHADKHHQHWLVAPTCMRPSKHKSEYCKSRQQRQQLQVKSGTGASVIMFAQCCGFVISTRDVKPCMYKAAGRARTTRCSWRSVRIFVAAAVPLLSTWQRQCGYQCN